MHQPTNVILANIYLDYTSTPILPKVADKQWVTSTPADLSRCEYLHPCNLAPTPRRPNYSASHLHSSTILSYNLIPVYATSYLVIRYRLSLRSGQYPCCPILLNMYAMRSRRTI